MLKLILFKTSVILFFTFLLISNNQVFSDEIVYNKNNSPYVLDTTLVINVSDTLIITEGTIVLLDTSVDISVLGHIFVYGTIEENVSFLPINDTIGWGQIIIDNYGSNSEFNNAVIENGTIFSKNVNIKFNNVDFINSQELLWNNPIIEIKSGSLQFLNCSIFGSDKGEGLLINNAFPSVIRNSYFTRVPDALEIINSIFDTISNNTFENIPDDAIDLNYCRNVIIDSNIIFNADDRGMEIGHESFGSSINVQIKRNLICYCNEGILFKDGSSGEIINNSLYENNTGIRCAELTQGYGGAFIDVENTIISNSSGHDILYDSLSEIFISYSLSNNSLLPGDSNIFDDPKFVDPANNDFSLQNISPCIDNGNPESPIDPDSTTADIGAYYYSIYTNIIKNDPAENSMSLKLYPNPFSSFLVIDYEVKERSKVKIDIFDLYGNLIYSLVNETQAKSKNSVKWYPQRNKTTKAGIYFCTITINEFRKTQKIAFLPF